MSSQYFYIATYSRFIKVGVTKHPLKRLYQLRQDFGVKWELHHVMQSDSALEIEAAIVAMCLERYGVSGVTSGHGFCGEVFEACPVVVSLEAEYFRRHPLMRMCTTCLEEFRPTAAGKLQCSERCQRSRKDGGAFKLTSKLEHSIKAMRNARKQSEWENEVTMPIGEWEAIQSTLVKALEFVIKYPPSEKAARGRVRPTPPDEF